MKKIKIYLIPLLSIYLICLSSNKETFDLGIYADPVFADALGRLALSFIDCLGEEFSINLYRLSDQKINTNDFSNLTKSIVAKSEENQNSLSKIGLYTSLLWVKDKNLTPDMSKSDIKIAYSMLESSQIPDQWVEILNRSFDAVIVPSTFLIKVYEESGVKIPIFQLPIPLDLGPFLSRPIKNRKKTSKFTFGITAGLWPRKNHLLLIKAFEKLFGNNPNVRLKIHSRGGWDDPNIRKNIEKIIHNKVVKNIEFIVDAMPLGLYIDFLESLNCLVTLSKGEGFSIPPYEALSLGIPYIISNNTAHKNVCDIKGGLCLESNVIEPAFYNAFAGECGFQFNMNLDTAVQGLKEMYKNYNRYSERAIKSRTIMFNFSGKALSGHFKTMFKPNKISLGIRNEIMGKELITTSEKLKRKYESVYKELLN